MFTGPVLKRHRGGGESEVPRVSIAVPGVEASLEAHRLNPRTARRLANKEQGGFDFGVHSG